MSELKPKLNLYEEIVNKKEFLKAYNKEKKSFDIKFPKKAFDKIIKFYGDDRFTPSSFISFMRQDSVSKIQRLKTMSKELDDNQVDKILEELDDYCIIPKSLQSLEEEDLFELGIKIKGKILKDILKKANMNVDSLLDYAAFQIVSQEVRESRKTLINYYIYENIFKLIPLLKVCFKNNQNFEIAFYSYRNILKKSGIKLEEIKPYLSTVIKDINREELMKQVIPLYESVKKIQLKGVINQDIKDQTLYILKGGDMCYRYPNIPFNDFEKNRNTQSFLLNDLINKIENKKKDIKKIYDNTDNQIIEIKDINNKAFYIRKNVLEKIISSPESQFDEYKTMDVNDIEIIVSKKLLKENKSQPLVKIYNKNSSKEDFIYIPKNEIDSIFSKLIYVKQENIFKGKEKNDHHKEIKILLMDIECDSLPKLEESKPLYLIPGEKAIFDKTKNDLLDKINKDNKDILIYEKNNKFIPLDTIEKIKERDLNAKNKNIKSRIKNIINEEEIIIIEYKELFEQDIQSDYILIINEDSPDDKIIVSKNDLLKELNSWKNPNNNIKLKNKINNNEIEINPSKIAIITPKKEQIPQNYENIQVEIKEKIKPENALIKTNNYFIKKTIAKKIISDQEDYDIYYIKDINDKKVKISKKQLQKDYTDEKCQYISLTNEEDPNNDIIVQSSELYTILEGDPMEEEISFTDYEGKKHSIKKTKIKIKPQEVEEINFEEQPQKIKNQLRKDIKDYFYLYTDKENIPHYIRGDSLNIIKNYKSNYPIVNFEVEDYKGKKVEIPKEKAIQLIENKDEIKYICLDDDESKDEPIFAEFGILEKCENGVDDPIEVNKEGKKIKLKNIKVKKLKEITSIGEQSEEKKFNKVNLLIKDVQKKEPLSDIIQVKDINGNIIFIYEDTFNKIEENKADPEKTTYKVVTPMKEEIICGKNPNKTSPNYYIKLVEPNIIVDKSEFEKALKDYEPNKKVINIKDIKGNSDIDPLNVNIYKASPEEVDIVKILPADFSDINQKILIDIIPQNKLILSKDLNNQDILIKKKEGDNLIKYPKKDFDSFSLYDKDGKKIKVSRKIIEKDNNDNNCEYIEIKDNDNNKNEIIIVSEFVKALNDKENEECEVRNKEGKKIKLNKKKIQIIKQDNKYVDIDEQGEEMKKKLLSDIKDSFIKFKDSKNNKDSILRHSQLNEVINHKQRAPFINYEMLNSKNEKVYITKEICQQKISNPENQLILCYDETKKENTFLIPFTNIKNSNFEGDDQFDVGDGKKILFKNLRIKKLEDKQEMSPQPEEEKMVQILTLLNKVKSGPLNKNYKTKDVEGNMCFVSNNYINKLQNESKGDEIDTKFKINDAFGKNKIILTKEIIDKDNNPGELILIKNKDNNQNYLVEFDDLVNNLGGFKSTDEELNIINVLNNEKVKINPLKIEITPPYNDFPVEKIANKKFVPQKIEDNKKEDGKEEKKIENKDKDIGRLRLRSMPVRPNIPEKKSYKIRRAIIYKRQRKDSQ